MSITAILIPLLALAISWAMMAGPGLRFVSIYEQMFGFRLNRVTYHAIVGVVAAIMFASMYGSRAISATVMLIVPIVVMSACIDMLVHRLPLRFTILAGLIVATGITLYSIFTLHLSVLLMCCVYGVASMMIALMLFMIKPGLGLGDVMLIPVMFALVGTKGFFAVMTAVVIMALAGAIHASIVASKSHDGWRASIAYGPWIVAGPLASLAIFSIAERL